MGADVLLFQFRNGVLAIGRLGLDRGEVRVFPVNGAPGTGPARLQARSRRRGPLRAAMALTGTLTG